MLLVIQNNICCIQKNLKSKRIGNFNMARFESSNCLSLTELHLDLFQMVAHCHQQNFQKLKWISFEIYYPVTDILLIFLNISLLQTPTSCSEIENKTF